MNDKHVSDLLPDYLDNLLSESDKSFVETHLVSCLSCKLELEQLKTVLNVLSIDPEPIPTIRLHRNLQQQIESEKSLLKPKKEQAWSGNVSLFLKIAAGIVIVFGAYIIGKLQAENTALKEMASVQESINSMKQETMLSLLQNRSASKRIQGVNYISEFADPDHMVLDGLIDRMLHDDNVNVRLASVEALSSYTKYDQVKTPLVNALKSETHPGIQIAIVRGILNAMDEVSKDEIARFLERDDVQPYVKDDIRLLLSTPI